MIKNGKKKFLIVLGILLHHFIIEYVKEVTQSKPQTFKSYPSIRRDIIKLIAYNWVQYRTIMIYNLIIIISLIVYLHLYKIYIL